MPLGPTQGRLANLSTVAITKHGTRRNSGSSTATMGRGLAPRKVHEAFTQAMRRSVGLSACGLSWNEYALNFSPHHGQFSIGTGAGRLLLDWRAMVFARAVVRSFSPFAPIRFGVAAFPTHNPISNGHAPSTASPFSARRISSAHIRVAARLSWSRVRRRSV